MAAPALRHDILRTETTTEDARRSTAARQRPQRSAAAPGTSAVAAPHSTLRHSARRAPHSPQRVSTRDRARHDGAHEDETEEILDTEHHVAARRKVRRGHTSRSLPRVPALAATLLMGQVLLLLYVSSLGMAATHAGDDLDKRIAATTEEIKQSQKRISSATSKPQMEAWARKLNLRLVQPGDFDRVEESARPVDSLADGVTAEGTTAGGSAQ